MPQGDSGKKEKTAAQVAEHCPLSDEGRALLGAKLTPARYVASLIAEKMYADAIRFTAFNLTKREAIWWGALCLWNAIRPESPRATPAPTAAVFRALIAWLQDPSEPNRRAVESAADEAGANTPQGQLAMAAFVSEGSISRPDLPEVLADPWLTARYVSGVVLTAAQTRKPPNRADLQRSFLVLAGDLSKQSVPWAPLSPAEASASNPTVSSPKKNSG